jgi:cytochrome c-type biogenesis protein CcmF
MEIKYIGEHFIAGQLGNISIYLALLGAIGAAVLYFFASSEKRFEKLNLYARGLYWSHSLFLTTAIGFLYYLIYSHAFEYQYVYEYSSRSLPFHFLLSCFWAGQEGSFLIWAFFQALLGVVFMKKLTKKDMPSMAMISIAQVFLMLMVLGLNVGDVSIGSSPFKLIRNVADNASQEFFKNPEYVKMIADGSGLNPLLENIWMAIHPPILFLGYAAVLIPFALAFGGFCNKDFSGWIKRAIPWTGFAALSLVIGIILGGAWAYIDLTFGGFWAWDPVENASLVPWLLSVSTLHFLLISRKYKNNITWAFILSGMAYTMVVYASYLTRSGVLKDTSAHAFGEEGRAFLLVIYTLVFFGFTLFTPIFRRFKDTERLKEHIASREFWIFVGGLVLVLSAFQVIVTTSIPVINKILGSNIAPPIDSVAYYNQWQLPYGILIMLLIGVAHYMHYGKNEPGVFFRRLIFPAMTAAFILLCSIFFFPFENPVHYVFLFFIVYSVYSAVEQFVAYNPVTRNTGAIITHFGIAIFLLGVLIAFSHDNTISGTGNKTKGDSQLNSNQVIFRNEPSTLGPYEVVYTGFENENGTFTFNLDFYKEGTNEKVFNLKPKVKANSKMGAVFEPKIKHFFNKDVYTFISYAGVLNSGANNQSIGLFRQEIAVNDSLKVGKYIIHFDSIASSTRKIPQGTDSIEAINITAFLNVFTPTGKHLLKPTLIMKGGYFIYEDDSLQGSTYRFRFENISQKTKGIFLGVYNKGNDYIVIKAMVFPWILILWAGAFITFIGFFIAIYRRVKMRPYHHHIGNPPNVLQDQPVHEVNETT